MRCIRISYGAKGQSSNLSLGHRRSASARKFVARSRSRPPYLSPPEPARYVYGAWTIQCKVTTTYLIEKAPAGQPELEKIAQKHQSASSLSSLVALPPGARKEVNEFLDRRKSSKASVIVMEPLKKQWNPFRPRCQERPMAMLVLRLREDDLDDGRSVFGQQSGVASPATPGAALVGAASTVCACGWRRDGWRRASTTHEGSVPRDAGG